MISTLNGRVQLNGLSCCISKIVTFTYPQTSSYMSVPVFNKFIEMDVKLMWKKKLLTLVLAFASLFLFTQNIFAMTSSPVQVVWNYESVPEVKAIVKEGRVFLPLRKTSDLLQGVTVWDQKTNTITIHRPETTISLNIGSKNAKVNGKVVSFDSPPFVTQGVTYVPLRFTATAFGIQVAWNAKENTVTVTTDTQLARANLYEKYFWFDTHSGNVYGLLDNKSVSKLGTTNLKSEGLSSTYSSITLISPNTYLFNTIKSGGTTLALRNHYQILIHDSKVVKSSKVTYFDGLKDINQLELNGQTIMRDDSTVLFVNSDGSTNESFDLATLTSLSDNNFTVEAAFDDYMLVRAHPNGTLWLVDRSTKKSIALYKTLLTKEQQQRIDSFDLTDLTYQGDGLSIVKQDGQNLSLTFKQWWSDNKESTFQYNIPN